MIRRLAFAFTLFVCAVASQAADLPRHATGGRDHPAKLPFPEMTLKEHGARGERAIQLLGTRLPEAANWHGKSEDEFRTLLRRDHRLRVDRRGRLYVEEELEAPVALAPAEASILDGTLLPLDQTYLLHSKPGARRTIYLNFRGATLVGTAWNTGGTSIVAKPFDLDGAPYSNSAAELQRIQLIWQRVAEDYAPFDVDVTTEPPPPEALNRSSSSDQVFGTTVLITHSSGVYSCSCGGVAYVGIFDETSDTRKPALVFYNQLGSGSEKAVAEAISHEAGHNVGLVHDGSASSGYYAGHGSGATGWAPIMGVGYSRLLVQWSKGEYAGADNAQDDVVVMGSNGLPVRADDHGDTPGTATLLPPSIAGGIATFAAAGVIERAADVDAFTITAGAGAATVVLGGAARSPNLDASIELRNAAGALIGSANPTDATTASLSVVLPAAGTYHLTVRGVGKGDPLGTGYSDYGSLGHYAVTITTQTPTGQPPVAALVATPTSGTAPLTVALSSAGSTDADGTIVSHEWTFGDGSTGTGAAASHVYSTPGTYTAQVRVTDDMGLSATKSVTITVNPVVVATTMHVADISMRLSTASAGTRAIATVTVRDAAGQPVPGATVMGRWSGIVSGNAGGITNSSGAAAVTSARTKARGTFAYTVTGVTVAGRVYEPAQNVETADSITK